MSRVVSFRLDEDKPDERAALDLLDQAVANGHTVREAIVWALLQAGDYPPAADPDREATADIRAALDEARQLVTALKQVGGPAVQPAAQDDNQRPLSHELQASIKRAAKAGRRLE